MPDSVPRASRKQAPKAFPAAGAASAGPPPGASSLLFLRGRDADGRIRRLIAARHALRPALGALARQLVKRRAHEPLGFRSLGDYPLSGAVEGEAADVYDIIRDIEVNRQSERAGRLIDGEGAQSMERKKAEGYF